MIQGKDGIKAFFIDFYGTVVHEDGLVIKEITRQIMASGHADNESEIAGFWWKEFQDLFMSSHGVTFQTQRALEEESLRGTLVKFGSDLDAKELGKLMFAGHRVSWIRAGRRLYFRGCKGL